MAISLTATPPSDENLGDISLGVLYTSFTAFSTVGSAVVRWMCPGGRSSSAPPATSSSSPLTSRSPGDMLPGDPHLVFDYSQHGFPKTAAHFGLGGFLRNGNSGWCRICMFNCGSAENLDLHVQTREHQQCAMDIVLKMKQDVAKSKN